MVELYLFRLFVCLGYELTVHPELEGSGVRPDFRVQRGDSAFFLEALTVFSGIVDEGRDAAREARILDIVNEVKSAVFSVNIEFERVGRQRPRRIEIMRPLEAWLARLDPDAIASPAPILRLAR